MFCKLRHDHGYSDNNAYLEVNFKLMSLFKTNSHSHLHTRCLATHPLAAPFWTSKGWSMATRDSKMELLNLSAMAGTCDEFHCRHCSGRQLTSDLEPMNSVIGENCWLNINWGQKRHFNKKKLQINHAEKRCLSPYSQINQIYVDCSVLITCDYVSFTPNKTKL